MDLQIKNRVFIVTGGSKGIGLAITKSLLQEGAKVAICARSPDSLQVVKEQLSSDNLLVREVDVLNGDAMRAFVKEVADCFERLDGVVANAGAGTIGTIFEASEDDWTDQLAIKILGVTNLITPALPYLRKSDAGRIVIMNSVTAIRPEPSMAVVSAIRAAVENMAQTLALELSSDQICVNTISLGAIETERQKERHRKSGSSLDYKTWSDEQANQRQISLRRFGTPQEVSPFVTLCLSPLASYVTGATIKISGGL